MADLYTIDECECEEDFDNFCFIPSDGGQYDAATALGILENRYGGSMAKVCGGSYIVSYDSTKNDWLRKELNIK
jgi:hypothetical protein